MADQKKSRPRTFGRPEGDGNPPQPRNAGPQAPIAGMFTSSVKSIAAENETLRAERDKAVLSGSMLLELDPATIEDGLVSDRLEVRGDDQEFEDLKASIASRGQDQPITVRPRRGEEGYELIAGRRRLRVCRELGRTILARVQDLDDHDALAAMWSENNLRLNPTPLELGVWMIAVKERFGLANTDLLKVTGFSKGYVSELQKIGVGFPVEIRAILADPRKVSKAAALQIVDAWADRPSRKAIEGILDRAAGLSDTGKQVAAILKAGARQGAPKPEREKVEIVDSGGARRAVVTRTESSWTIKLDQPLSADQAGRIEEILRGG